MYTSIGASSAFSASNWVPRSGKGKKSSWSTSACLPDALNSSDTNRPSTYIPACLRRSLSAACCQVVPLGAAWEYWVISAVCLRGADIAQYYSPAPDGTPWQQAADKLLRKQAGMYVLGLFVSDEFKVSGKQADVDQLDFFPFPNLGTSFDAEKALDAPIDVYMMSKN